MHISVLLEPSIEYLNLKDDSVIVDCTLGYAGHSSNILSKIPNGKLYAFDQDDEAIESSNKRLSEIGKNYEIIRSNFVNIKEELNKRGINKVDGILYDLGVSSPQLDEDYRGFSFHKDAPLDMRMDTSNELTAKDVVNNYSIEELTNIFFVYGEEKMARVIAKKIASERINNEIKTTKELVHIIEKAVGAKYFNKFHPERQIFQAIRIEVNSELSVLTSVLPDAISLLNKNGRISVITFHSLEDRIVKQIFKSNSEVDDLVKGLPDIPTSYLPKLRLINKKPILPSEDEIKENTRSKSAKLRIAERI